MTPPLTPAEVAALIDEMQVRSRDYLCRLDDCRLLIKAAEALLALQAEARHARIDGRIAGLDDAYSIAEGYYRASDAQKAIRAAIRALAASEKEPK
jgi:hypothetical protein